MSRAQPDRLVVLADFAMAFPRTLLESFLYEIQSRDDVRLVAVCDTARTKPVAETWQSLVTMLRRLVRDSFNPPGRSRLPVVPRARLHQIAGRLSVPVIVPPERNVNDPNFVEQLRNELQPTLALSLGCLQILRPELLAVFHMAVNCHDGYLPDYKGLNATAWSLYRRETRTGYTYHVIDSGIDSGPVLLQDSIEIRSEATVAEVGWEKTQRAAGEAGRVLDLMVARAEGAAQRKPGSYFSAADRRRICNIDNPAQLDSGEILHRLRCFGVLNVRLGRSIYEITALRQADSRLSFTTADGVTLDPYRMLWLPRWLYGAYRVFRTKSH